LASQNANAASSQGRRAPHRRGKFRAPVSKRRGRPPLENPKEAVKLRLDHDVLAAYRKTGSGWQTRINADLRKAARKLAG
jgi:uncharacterized protein (DUF4415 family)